MALDYFYHLKNSRYEVCGELKFVEAERLMVMKYEELKNIKKMISREAIKMELRSLRSIRAYNFNKIRETDMDLFINFKQYSIVDPTGVPYYTIKKDIDMALYGLDKTDPYDYKIGIENNKWTTGEYNGKYEKYIDTDSFLDDESADLILSRSGLPIFEYYNDRTGRYRIRIEPQYIIDLRYPYKTTLDSI
jgi:hypothetical protein